jgi:hypothetical protein
MFPLVEYLLFNERDKRNYKAPLVDDLTPYMNSYGVVQGSVVGTLRMLFKTRTFSRLTLMQDFNGDLYPGGDNVTVGVPLPPPRDTPKVMYRLYVLVNGQIIFKSTNVNKLLENYEYVVPF